jgi:hypothetical protein
MARKFVLLLVFAGVCCIAQTQSTTTGGMLNGRAWLASERDARVMYIRGIQDGLVLAAALIDSKPDANTLLRHTALQFRPSDYIDEINTFFQDPNNVRIPIFYAWEYTNSKFKGAPQHRLDELMQTFRDYVKRHS